MNRLNQERKNGSIVSDSAANECKLCHGTGMEMYVEDGIEYARECRCGILQRQIMENRKTFADIPESFSDIRLNTFQSDIYKTANGRKLAEIAIKCIKHWLNDFESVHERGIGLYLYSRTKGSGKTRMATSIANELIYEKNIQVKFTTSMQILNEIKASWDRQNGDNENKLLDFLCTTDVLIIDDFGTENSEKPWVNERFYHIINQRYVHKKITIFTSNDSLDALRYDDRITNRIKERSFTIPFPEESIRNIIADNNMKELISEIKGEC